MRRRPSQPYEFSALATYNSEVARGIVHTDEWKARMAAEQELFNAQRIDEAHKNGWIILHTTQSTGQDVGS